MAAILSLIYPNVDIDSTAESSTNQPMFENDTKDKEDNQDLISNLNCSNQLENCSLTHETQDSGFTQQSSNLDLIADPANNSGTKELEDDPTDDKPGNFLSCISDSKIEVVDDELRVTKTIQANAIEVSFLSLYC